MEASEIYRESIRYFLRPIAALLEDDSVSEVMINGPETVYFERGGRIHRSDLQFSDAAALMAAVRNIAEYVNRPIGAGQPSLDARLPDGSRVHAILPPGSRSGVCLSIRKFLRLGLDLPALVEHGCLDGAASDFLAMAVLLKKNLIISGGTGTGKTSLLNALSSAIPRDERIIVIEDSSELRLDQPHTIYLEAQPADPDGRGELTIRMLFVNALRMRPDRVIIGEVRRGEALDLIQAMLSGHAGSLATVHASTPRGAATRLELLCMMSEVVLPAPVARAQVASAVDLVIQLARFPDGSRRVQEIAEVRGLDTGGSYQMADLFRFRPRGRTSGGSIVGGLEATGQLPSFANEPWELGLEEHIGRATALFPPLPASELPSVPDKDDEA